MRTIRHILGELLALAFPLRCGACGAYISPTDRGLCLACARQTLAMVDQHYCGKCGQDAGPFALRSVQPGGVAVCGLCDVRLYRYAGLVRVGSYADPLGRMVRRFKYSDAYHLAGLLGDWQADRLLCQPWLAAVDALVPIPLHWRRWLERGFNQAELLAERVAARLARPCVDALARPVHRPAQAGLPRSMRFENVRGAFAVARSKGREIRGRRLCLIDDVCTTGATLSEAARTLLAGGAAEVFAAVVAVAQPPPAYSAMMHDPI